LEVDDGDKDEKKAGREDGSRGRRMYWGVLSELKGWMNGARTTASGAGLVVACL